MFSLLFVHSTWVSNTKNTCFMVRTSAAYIEHAIRFPGVSFIQIEFISCKLTVQQVHMDEVQELTAVVRTTTAYVARLHLRTRVISMM